MLADEVVSNATDLQAQLEQLMLQLVTSTSLADDSEMLLDQASGSLDASESLLNTSEGSLDMSHSRLAELGGRLRELEAQIDQNELDFAVAQNLTESAVLLADQAESVSPVVLIVCLSMEK